MQLTPNPIYKHAPEEYFPAVSALDLAQAIRRDDVAGIEALFTSQPTLDPNQAGQQGITFLLWAFAHHHIPAMQALVRHGADPNRPLQLPAEAGEVDTTHLVNIATEGPQDELLVALLDLGADPNAVDERKVPAVQNAIYINNYPRMQLLLDRGADINAPNSSGATAVVVLARLGAFEVVYELLERGADWHKLDNEVALWTQENEVDDAEATQWQIKVKHWLIAHGVKFPVPSSGAARYASIRQRWEQTPEGYAWRVKLDALGAQPDVVGRAWTQEEDAATQAMRAWMQQAGVPFPLLITDVTQRVGCFRRLT